MNTSSFDSLDASSLVFNQSSTGNQPNTTQNIQLTHLMALFKLQNTMNTNSLTN